MMCRMFDDTKKRCQEGRCEKCKLFSPERGDEYEPLPDIEYGNQRGSILTDKEITDFVNYMKGE